MAITLIGANNDNPVTSEPATSQETGRGSIVFKISRSGGMLLLS
jgi:hypothetical protein